MDEMSAKNVVCLWCCHPPDMSRDPKTKTLLFPAMPLAVGMRPEKDGYGHRWGIRFFFCGLRCALAYARDTKGLPVDTVSLTRCLAKEYLGIPVMRTVPPARHRSDLSMFGGPLTIEEFRGNRVPVVVIHSNIRIFSAPDHSVPDFCLQPNIFPGQRKMTCMPRNVNPRPTPYNNSQIFKNRAASPKNILKLVAPPKKRKLNKNKS